jgi:hypothetical protein
MIKKYNQFVKTNENAPAPAPAPGTVPAPTETPTPTTPRPARPSVVPTERPSEQDNPLAYGEMEVEGGLEGLAAILSEGGEEAKIDRNVLHYDGHEIDQPSETGKFRVDGIDLKTDDPEKVVAYLNNPEAQAEAQAKREKRVQAQAQRRAQAQGEFEKGPDKTETGLDPEAQALKAQVVDIDQIGESKSYKNRFFRRKF